MMYLRVRGRIGGDVNPFLSGDESPGNKKDPKIERFHRFRDQGRLWIYESIRIFKRTIINQIQYP